MNVIESILNISQLEILDVKRNIKSKNRINNIGDSLENFVENSFTNFNTDLELKSKTFSWLGNAKNPPDLILRNSDAIEVKKMNTYSTIALNSSFPRNRIFSTDPMLTKNCSEIDGGDWEKNIYYFIGVMDKDSIETLFIIDGSLYSADREIYQKIKKTIKDSVTLIEGTEFSETKELGRVNKVDPLGITHLRIRGMWGIENPFKVFNYISGIEKPTKGKSKILALISETNWDNFPQESRNKIYKITKDIKVQNPNNPAELIKAKFIRIDK